MSMTSERRAVACDRGDAADNEVARHGRRIVYPDVHAGLHSRRDDQRLLADKASTASRSDSVTGGTTEEMIAPSKLLRSIRESP